VLRTAAGRAHPGLRWGGLLGIAVDPAFADSRRLVYLSVTTPSGVQVQRWRFLANRLRRDGIVLLAGRRGREHGSFRVPARV